MTSSSSYVLACGHHLSHLVVAGDTRALASWPNSPLLPTVAQLPALLRPSTTLNVTATSSSNNGPSSSAVTTRPLPPPGASAAGPTGSHHNALSSSSWLLTMPGHASRELRETVAEELFEHHGVGSIFMLPEAVAATFATGNMDCRVLDLGHLHLTATAVSDGVTAKYYTVGALGMANLLPAAASLEGDLPMVPSRGGRGGGTGGDGLVVGPPHPLERLFFSSSVVSSGGVTTKSKQHRGSTSTTALSLLQRLPREFEDDPVLLVGGGAGIPGVASRFREELPDGEQVVCFTQPALTAAVGGSLFASLCCEASGSGTSSTGSNFFVTKAAYEEEGKDVVHWRFPT